MAEDMDSVAAMDVTGVIATIDLIDALSVIAVIIAMDAMRQYLWRVFR